MNKYLLSCIVLFATFASLFAALNLGAAQARSTESRRGDLQPAPPDLTGVWDDPGGMDISKDVISGDEFLLTPYGAERFRTVDHAKDPSVSCLPFGPVRAICCLVHPNMIVQHPNVVVILTESQRTYRLIYTDGRDHPKDIEDYPEWMGSSIGHWEGDTLVVETIGIDDRTWLDNGHEHSNQLRLVERFQLTDPNTIKWTVRIEDPIFFVKPFTIVRQIKRQVGDRIMSHSCLENEKDKENLVPTLGGVR